MCKNCNTLVRCIEDESGLIEVPVKTCDKTKGEYCYQDKECSNAFNPECQNTNYSFTCTSTGVFPDPFNCKKYYYCVRTNATKPVSKFEFMCGDDWGYNMVTTYCDKPVKNCPENSRPCPACKNGGDSGALENKSIWYLCITDPVTNQTLPQLHLCPNGKWYDGTGCVPQNQFSTTTPATTTPTTTKKTV